MANVLVEETSLEDIADAIRSKNGTSTKYKPAEMADAISAISGGGITPSGTKQINITQNGTVTEDVTNYANAQVNVNVPSVSPTGTKQVSIAQNGTTTEDVTNYASAEISVNVPNSYSASDEGKVVSNGALVAQTSRSVTSNGTIDTTLNNSVEINVPSSGITPTGTKNITTNGDHDVTQYATAHVDVPTGITPSGSQEFTQNGTYDVTNLAEAVVNVSGGGGITTKFHGTVEMSGVSTTSISIPISGYQLTGSEKFMATLKLVGTGTYSSGVITWDDEIQVPSDISNSNRLIVSGFYSNRRLGINTINNSSGTAVSGGKTAANSVFAVNTTAAGGAVSTNNNTHSIDTTNNAIVLNSNTGYKYCNTTWATRFEYEVYLLTSSGTLV